MSRESTLVVFLVGGIVLSVVSALLSAGERAGNWVSEA